MELLTKSHTADVASAGGKGFNLLKLAKASYKVPRFVIIPSGFLQEIGHYSQPQKLFALETIINKIISELSVSRFAVRSSVCAEDGTEYSFAGQFKTILNVSADNLAEAVLEVHASASSQQTATYKHFAGVNEIRSAVIIQQMVDADSAGVAFSINPLNGNKEEIVINAVKGSGESLVSGQANADTYIFNRRDLSEPSATNTGSSPVLNKDQSKQVAKLLIDVEDLYRHPQDIEFAFAGAELFLLQARPVTTSAKKLQTIIWDNSNIVESYPGITLPLTSSFIDKVYAAVYRQLCAVLGVTNKKLTINQALFENLLGFINGRVYYNLNSWFGILALLPGYHLNADFMEKMMGVKNKPEFEATGVKSKKTFYTYIEVLNAARCILGNLFTANKQRRRFIKDFETVYNKFSITDYDKLTAAEVWSGYCTFEKLMVERWKAPLVNDFFTMIYFGVLQKFCSNYLPGDKNICNELIASSKDIITTEPARLLPLLAAMINSNEQLKNIFLADEAGKVWEQLQSEQFSKEYRAVKKYLDTWGERCMSELKLETITYRQEPSKLIEVLQSYIKNELFVPTGPNTANDKRIVAEKKMHSALSGYPFKRLLYKHVLTRARYFISNRENLRYYRTKGFGLVREMMSALGEKFKAAGMIDDSRDIFYLKLNEIEELIKNPGSIQSLIKSRKEAYSLFEELNIDERVITIAGGDKYFTYPAQNIQASEKGITTLQGIPCSPGVVQAKVRLVTHSKQLTVLNREIMATYATDPGWVVLFPSSAGILTERGSLLSHAAIVSREMGIPCIVGLTGLMQHLKDGDTIIMDGSTGIVNILTKANEHSG